MTDDGVGIAADELPHVFDRFWRSSRAAGLATRGSVSDWLWSASLSSCTEALSRLSARETARAVSSSSGCPTQPPEPPAAIVAQTAIAKSSLNPHQAIKWRSATGPARWLGGDMRSSHAENRRGVGNRTGQRYRDSSERQHHSDKVK